MGVAGTGSLTYIIHPNSSPVSDHSWANWVNFYLAIGHNRPRLTVGVTAGRLTTHLGV